MFSKHLFKTYLKTNILGQKIIYKNKTSSTNTDAKEYLYNKNFHGSIFVSDNQYNGRGRRGSSWESIPHKSLTFSLLLHPEIKLKNIGLIPLAIGIGIVKGILISTSISAGLKWPNDIIINNKKIAGIMTEIVDYNNTQYIIIGAGINILTSPEIMNYKTCSLLNYKDNLNYENVLINFIESFCNEYKIMTSKNYDEIFGF